MTTVKKLALTSEQLSSLCKLNLYGWLLVAVTRKNASRLTNDDTNYSKTKYAIKFLLDLLLPKKYSMRRTVSELLLGKPKNYNVSILLTYTQINISQFYVHSRQHVGHMRVLYTLNEPLPKSNSNEFWRSQAMPTFPHLYDRTSDTNWSWLIECLSSRYL